MNSLKFILLCVLLIGSTTIGSKVINTTNKALILNVTAPILNMTNSSGSFDTSTTSYGAVLLRTNSTNSTVDYLVNGNFANTTCIDAWCLYNTKTYNG